VETDVTDGVDVAITFDPPLVPGVLLRRYKRFLADVELANGKTVTALCSNTGTMKTCCEAGREVRLSYHPGDSRKYPLTWEMIKMDAGWVGVNTGVPNLLTAMAVKYGAVPELISYTACRREVKYGQNSRIDLLLEGPAGPCYVEVKNVSMGEKGAVLFPDAVTERGLKHLEELMGVVACGQRAVMLFLVQRPDGAVFRPADAVDPAYGAALRRAREAGVEVLAYRARVSPERISWGGPVPLDF
jgi:sugar fermentation stimulation protein A